MAHQNNTETEEYELNELKALQNSAVARSFWFLPLFFILSVAHFIFLRNIDQVPLYDEFPFSEAFACGYYSRIDERNYTDRIFYSNIINGAFLISVLLSVLCSVFNKNLFVVFFRYSKNNYNKKQTKPYICRAFLYFSAQFILVAFFFYMAISTPCLRFVSTGNSGTLLPGIFGLYLSVVLAPFPVLPLMGLTTGVFCSARALSASKKLK